MRAAVERRRCRRAGMDLAVTLRAVKPTGESGAPMMARLKDLSLAGVCCFVKAPCALTVGEPISCAVEIPPEQHKLFPFARVQGRGWVIRVEPVTIGRREGDVPEEESGPWVGVAISFSPDVAALATIS